MGCVGRLREGPNFRCELKPKKEGIGAMLTKNDIIDKALDLGIGDIGFTTADPFDSQKEILEIGARVPASSPVPPAR